MRRLVEILLSLTARTGHQHPNLLASFGNYTRLLVAMGRSDRVAEINPATLRIVRSFPTGHRTWGIALSPDDRRLYAASGLSGTLTIVDLDANRVLHTVQLGGKPWSAVAVPR